MTTEENKLHLLRRRIAAMTAEVEALRGAIASLTDDEALDAFEATDDCIDASSDLQGAITILMDALGERVDALEDAA